MVKGIIIFFTLILEDIIGLWIGEKSLFTEKPSKDSHIAKKVV